MVENLYLGTTPIRNFSLDSDNKITTFSSFSDGNPPFTKFRYAMIEVSALYDDNNTIQFSKLRFLKDREHVDDCFQYCSDMTEFNDLKNRVNFDFYPPELRDQTGDKESFSEQLEKSLYGIGDSNTEGKIEGEQPDGLSYGKMCYTGIPFPSYFAYDFDKQEKGIRLNISTYNKWCWYSSNDTFGVWTEGDRNMETFNLYVSEDAITWYLADQVSDRSLSGTYRNENYSMQYFGDVDIERYATYDAQGKKHYRTITLELFKNLE